MPLYDYRCNGCGKTFEIQQKLADADLTKCEACGEDKLEKLISWAAFGSGDSTKALYSNNPGAGLSVDKGKRPKKS